MRELLHLTVVHGLAEVRTDEHNALRILNVRSLWRAYIIAVRESEAYVAWPAALRKRGCSNVVGAVGSERVLEERAAKSVDESSKRFGTVGGLDLLHLLGDKVQRFIPGNFLPLLLATLTDANQRRAQTVGIGMRTDSSGAARAKTPARERIERVAFNLPQLSIAHAGDGAAFPEADVAEGGNGAQTVSYTHLRAHETG